MIERHLDYVQFTGEFQENEFKKEDYEACSGLPYYPRGYRDKAGTRFNFGHNRGANCFVVMSGEVLSFHRNEGVSDAEILQWVAANGGKVSRLDLAVTEFIEERLFSLETVKFWWHKGLIDSSLVEGGCKEIVEHQKDWVSESQTIYIGEQEKRAKKGIFRAYDRGIAMGLGAEIITRIELELKREKAQNAAKRIEKSGDIAGNFRTYFNVRHQEFERIMDADAVVAVRGKGKGKSVWEDEQMKRWEWLINQVAPALKEAIVTDRERLDRDDRLEQFLIAAGLTEDMVKAATSYANNKYRDKLQANELVERSSSKKE